ncbi:hypothetical protein Daus18300_012415 [Diaporthe australafricana]|uniref:IBR domain-containing protein n=1 Tax=Diaporthe australafricana TaxID=127596 RepID=A0ABR3W3E7_9PEZI
MGQSIEDEVPVYGAYFSAEALRADDRHGDDDEQSIDGSSDDSNSEDELIRKIKKKKRVFRNVTPVSVIKPEVEYQTKVPTKSTIIANISQRRLDKIPVTEESRTDICLPCGLDTVTTPELSLHKLPCGHRWCSRCLARTFKFAIANNTFHRFQCCTENEIPMRYFKGIIEKRPHPKPEFEPGYEPGTSMEIVQAEEQEISELAEVREFNPLRVSESVRKETEPFINKKDWNTYMEKLEEYETLPKDKMYCYRKICGSFIPMADRTKTKGHCPRCRRFTCCRCRRGWHTHQSNNGRCDACKDRMTVVNNDRKFIVMARRKGWKRCPRCRMFVEKTRGGCGSVYCRCGRHFWYS